MYCGRLSVPGRMVVFNEPNCENFHDFAVPLQVKISVIIDTEFLHEVRV